MASLLIPGFLVFGMLLTVYINVSRLARSDTFVDKLEGQWKAGALKDPIEAMIAIERERRTPDVNVLGALMIKPFGILLGGLVALIVCLLFLVRYYPVYNFCWGEYLEEFTRREAARRFWLIIIGVGFAVSFVASIVANRVRWGL